MSNELVRYNGSEQGLAKVSEARRTMDLALVKLRGANSSIIEAKPERDYQIIPPRQTCTRAGEILDLARVCAVHDRLYVSRYVQGADGFFHYGQSIRITSKSSEQYRAGEENPGSLPSSDLEEETCPWCGASGHGAILCSNCHAEVCYGRTMGSTFFHCRESCTGSGTIVGKHRATRGLRPQLDSGSTPYSGG